MKTRALATLLLLAATSGCTSMLPMTHNITAAIPEDKVAEIMERTKVSREQVLDPTIHRVDENKIGCWEMVRMCWPSMPWYLKALGSVPLACTTIYQWPDGTKSATINHCWWTDGATMAHEREHTQGKGHAYW